jgi:hypothetical protein
MAPNNPINTYASYYRETDWQEQRVNPVYVMREFVMSEDGTGTKTGQQLHDDVRATWNDMPHAYVTLVKDESRLVLLHRANYHVPPLGTTPEVWNNKLLVYTGDVMENQIPQAVFFPPLLLAATQQVITVDCIEQQLLNFVSDDSLQLLDPTDPATPEDLKDDIRTRHAMYLPPQFVHLFLERRLTPRQALLSVHAALTTSGTIADYKPLMDWLRVAATKEGHGAIERASGPGAPIMDAVLQARLVSMVRQDLPGWNVTTTATGPAPPPVPPAGPTRLETLLAEILIAQQPRGATTTPAGDRDKLPSETWKGTIDVLLRLTQRSTEEALPPLWHAWANCKKEERRAVLQEQFRRLARVLKLPEPVATVELTNMLYSLAFAAPFEDKLEMGVQPFAVTYLSQKTVAEQREIIDLHELLREGAPSLTDILDLKAASRIAMPTKESQMLRTIRAFAVVLATIVGPTSPLYTAYKRDIVDAYDQVQPRLETLSESHPGEPIHAQLLRWLQLRFQEYWAEAEIVLGEVSPPNFRLLYEAIRYKQWHRPEIPASYLQTPKRPRPTEASGGTSGGTTPGKKAAAPAPAAAAIKHSYLRNEHPESDLMAKGQSMGRITVFLKIAGGSAPKADTGQEVCLAYHTKGGCYEDCARAKGHAKLNAAELARVTAYIDKGLEKMATPAEPASGP